MRLEGYLQRLRSDPHARGSAFMIMSQASVTLLQGLQFLLLARALGAHEFGRVASVVAITSILLPFSGMGLGSVAIMRIARGQAQPASCLGNGLAVIAVTGTLGVALALSIGEILLTGERTWLLILLLGTSEILLTKVVDFTANVFLGMERQALTALFFNLQMITRLAMAGLLYWGIATPTAVHWAWLHLAAGLLSATVVLLVSIRLMGRPQVNPRVARRDAGYGFFFSLVVGARSVHTDFDKAALARMASHATAGAYTAAFRLMYMACTPITAVLGSMSARIFRMGGKRGLRGSLSAMRRIALIACVYCLVLAGLFYAAAPALPWLLGASYELAPDVLRSLCLLPLLLTVQALASDALSGADAQRRVSTLHTLTAGSSVLLNLLLVPIHGWTGAVIAAYASQGFLVGGLVITILLTLQTQRRAATA